MAESLDFVIRKAEPADSAGVLGCLAEAFEPYRDRYTPAGYTDTVLTPETLVRRMESMTILVAVNPQGEIVGTIGCGLAQDADIAEIGEPVAASQSGFLGNLGNSGDSAIRSPDGPMTQSPDFSVEGHLRGMAVRSRWQGAGVAGQLLKRAESELRSRNCSRITLDTTLPLERAMRFYEKHGYRRSGRQQDFFGMPLIEYEKKIST